MPERLRDYAVYMEQEKENLTSCHEWLENRDLINKIDRNIEEYLAGLILSVPSTARDLARVVQSTVVMCQDSKERLENQASFIRNVEEGHLKNVPFASLSASIEQRSDLQRAVDIFCPIRADVLDNEEFEFAHEWINLLESAR